MCDYVGLYSSGCGAASSGSGAASSGCGATSSGSDPYTVYEMHLLNAVMEFCGCGGVNTYIHLIQYWQ